MVRLDPLGLFIAVAIGVVITGIMPFYLLFQTARRLWIALEIQRAISDARNSAGQAMSRGYLQFPQVRSRRPGPAWPETQLAETPIGRARVFFLQSCLPKRSFRVAV